MESRIASTWRCLLCPLTDLRVLLAHSTRPIGLFTVFHLRLQARIISVLTSSACRLKPLRKRATTLATSSSAVSRVIPGGLAKSVLPFTFQSVKRASSEFWFPLGCPGRLCTHEGIARGALRLSNRFPPASELTFGFLVPRCLGCRPSERTEPRFRRCKQQASQKDGLPRSLLR